MANKLNFTHDQGSTFKRTLTFKDSDSDEIDLTGYEFKAQARTKITSADVVFEFEFTILDQTSDTGKVEMSIAANITEDLSITKSTSYVYDAEMTATNGEITRIFEGKITISPEVTK